MFLNENCYCNTFIQQGSIKLIKTDCNDTYNVTKYFYFK